MRITAEKENKRRRERVRAEAGQRNGEREDIYISGEKFS